MENRVDLIWAQRGQMDEGQFMQEHCHACYQMYYVLSGNATFVVGEETLRVSNGCCFIISETVPHKMHPLSKEGLRYYEIKLYIKDPFLKERLKPLNVIENGSEILENMLNYVVDNWTCQDEQNLKDIEYILTTLILNFFVKELNYENKNSKRIITTGYSDITRSILVYIESYFSYKFNLESLGQNLNYNKNYLCYVFKKDTGVSIVDYLNFTRIRQAIIFFAYYSQDVYTTCESVGFSNLSHFSRTFKALVGIAPRDFRRAFSQIAIQGIEKYFADELILSYKTYTMAEALGSLKSIGQRAKELLERVEIKKK